ncbi:hypothetical protein JXB02_02125 [Candidatus Woesearchaeota archaeon]|nr:hypothetical protein [Candidatus Woesearchaeota archaeon]
MGAAFVKDGLSGGTRAYTAQHRAMELGINMDVKGIRQIINDPSVLDPYQYIMCFQCEYARKELHNLLTALSGSKTIIFDSDSFTKYPNGTAADSSLWSTLTGIDTQRSKTTTDTIDFGNGTVLNLSDTYDIYSVDGLGLPGTVFMDKDNKTLLYKNDGNYYIGIPMWAAWWENVETRKALDGIWRYILNDLSIPEDEYYLTQFNASTMFFRSHSDDGQVFGLSWRQDNRTVNLSTHTGNDYTVEYAPAGNIAGTADYGGMTYLTGSIYDIIVWDTNHSGNPPLDNYPSIVPDWPGIFFSSPASFSVFFNCSASDDQLLASVALLTNESGSLAVVHSEPASGTSDTLSYTHPFPGDGVYAWACRATDNASQQATTSARIVSVGFVSPPNPPVLEMPTNGETTADQTPTLSWQNGTDPDQGDTLTHRLVVTNASGSVHDAPHDTESYTFTQNLSNGLYNWHVQAEDTTARTADSATWTFTINYTGPPQPPYFDPEPTGQIAIEDQHFSYDIGATDPNGDEINYFDDHPGFAIDQDGVIDWTPTNDDVGPNPVNISIYDGTFFAWTLITITVNNVNDAPTAPQLTFANQTVANTTVTLTWLPGHDIDATDTLVHTLTLATDEALTALVHRQNHTGTSRAFALSDGTTYYWTVSCTDGFATATAPTGSFTVDTSYVAPYCGDGTCQTDEGCDVCAADCGACPYCGDGRCQDEEDCESCRADCGDCEEPSRRSGGGSGSTDFYVERTAVTETATAGGAGSEEQPEALAEEAPAAGSQTGTAAEATGALGQQMQGAEEGGIEVLYEEPRQIGEETGNDLFILTPSDIVKIVVLALVAGFLTFFVMAKFTTGEALIAKMKRKLIKRPATVYDLRDILLAHRGITLVRAAKLLGDGLPHTKDLMDFLFHEGLVSRQGKYYSPTQALEEMRDERRR